MGSPLTAQQIVERIKARIGATRPGRVDGFAAGDPSTAITGIATTFVPSLEVMKKAVAAQRNLIVSFESPYWGRNPKQLAQDPVFMNKQAWITEHGLVIYRLHDAWLARGSDGQLAGLARALGWQREERAPESRYFTVRPMTLAALAREVSAKLKLNAARVIGDSGLIVRKVAVTHGMITAPELARVLQEPFVDAVLIGEPIEWEASPYFQDVIASGQKKGLVAMGLAGSEEPGSGEVATWLKSIVTEVPVEWIPAGAPFAAGRWT